MPHITVNGQKLFFTKTRGPKRAPAVVLIHGAGGTHLDWPAGLRRLPNAPVYALDLPGHGRSEPPGRDDVDAYAGDVLAFLAAVAPDDVVLAGHSMGGAIAQAVALRHPPQLRGLVLIATGARLRVADAILGRVLDDFPGVADTITEFAWAPGAPDALKETGREMLLQADPEIVHGDYAACNRFDVIGELDTIAVPTLVIGGTADRMTPLKYAHFLANHIPDARLITVEGGGHMVMLERPGQVAEAVAGFVDEMANGFR